MTSFFSERGSVPIVEGSILLPISFFLVFLMIFTASIFYKDAFYEGRIRRALSQPTTSPSYSLLEEEALVTTLKAPPTFQEKGFFYKTMKSQAMIESKGKSPFQFFRLPSEIRTSEQRTAVWSSSTNNLWRYEAINGFAVKMRITQENS